MHQNEPKKIAPRVPIIIVILMAINCRNLEWEIWPWIDKVYGQEYWKVC